MIIYASIMSSFGIILEAEWFGRIRANLFGVRSRQGGASRKCPVDIFSERAGLKYGKVKIVSASLFNTDMASKTESKNPKPLCFGYSTANGLEPNLFDQIYFHFYILFRTITGKRRNRGDFVNNIESLDNPTEYSVFLI